MSILNHASVQIPDEAVHAAMDEVHAYGYVPDRNDFLNMKSAIAAAIPHLSSPCAVEMKKCQMCNGHGTKDYAGFAMDLCECMSDDAAVDSFARLMKSKLAKKRREGRRGWQGMSADELTEILRQHVDKGDPVDVANLCMMLSENGQSISPAAPNTEAGK